MKILFDNYNTITSTEATSLSHALSYVDVENEVWDKRISAFEIFDRIRPDVFVTSYTLLTEDVLKRMGNDKCKLIVNVAGITEEEAVSLEETLDEMKIKVAFAIYPFSKPKGFKKIKTLQMMPAADIFLPSPQPGNRQIPFAVIYNDAPVPVEGVGEVYHKIIMNEALLGADVNMSVMDICSNAGIYRNAMIVGKSVDFVCSQVFFDMTIRMGGKTRINMEQVEDEKAIGDFLMSVFPELPGDPEAAELYFKSHTLRKHTYINRAERLMKNLGDDNAVANLRKFQESLKNNLQNPRS